MPETWPPTIDKKVLRGGFSQKAVENTIRSTVEAGLDKLRKRYTSPIIKMNVNMWIDFTQYESLETFYNTTLQGGVLSFTFPDPATGDDHEYRFLSTPH